MRKRTKRKTVKAVSRKRSSKAKKRSAAAIAADKKKKAKKPGKRVSKSGRVYYEHRENRADKDLRKRL